TILLPRRINRRFRYSKLYYRTGWLLWRGAASSIPSARVRESALSIFGPLSMLGLFVSWVFSLIAGFALLHWSLDSHLFAPATSQLRDWEHWSAELLESHISFPVLAYYRSQHANQSWLAALTTMLDASALLLTILPARDTYQAQLTFAMARHAAVDIALIFAI